MIITLIDAGLGNQLFMYACGYAAARRLGTKLMLDSSYLDTQTTRHFELDKFNLRYDKHFTTRPLPFKPLKDTYRKLFHAYVSLRYTTLIEDENKRSDYDKRFTHLHDNTLLKGYWQTEKFFKDYRADLLQMMEPSYQVSAGCAAYIAKAGKPNTCAVHVRRGDYEQLNVCLPPSYYHHALALAKEKIGHPQFFVFSDDIDYAKSMFADQEGPFEYVQYPTAHATVEDLLIMKSCRHIITANSSYSWWGAWLNANPAKLVICPGYWDEGDFYPPEWIKI